MTTPNEIYPRSVTPGIETQPDQNELPEPGVSVGLDWLRVTGREDARHEVIDTLCASFGAQTESSSGAAHYRHGVTMKPGILISWGHPSSICQIDVQGSRLRLMSGHARVELLRLFMEMGLRPRRIDGAVDFVDQGLNLYENALASCEREEHCRFQRWAISTACGASNTPTRLMISMGARDSPMYGRIYDKGLEQRVAERGRWERMEIEWKGNKVDEVARTLCDAGDTWPDVLASLIFGAIDFRKVNGRPELGRRPRVAWWEQAMSGSDGIRVQVATEPKTFESWHDGFVRSYGRRLLELAEAVDRPLNEIVDFLLGGALPSNAGGPVVDQFVTTFPLSRRMLTRDPRQLRLPEES